MMASIAAVLVLLNPVAADACPNCKYALEVTRAIAFGASVLLMMSMPFAIGAVWCLALVRANRSDESKCS